jgi:hypothetical protein
MTKGQTILWPKENDKRTNYIMTKGKRQKDKQYIGQRKNEKRTNNITDKGKTRKGQTI